MPGNGTKLTERRGRPVPKGPPESVDLDSRNGYPLFQRRKTKQNGETHELTLGPCLASVAKWIILALLAFGLMKTGANAAEAITVIRLMHFFW
jgi:hypothetical protein